MHMSVRSLATQPRRPPSAFMRVRLHIPKVICGSFRINLYTFFFLLSNLVRGRSAKQKHGGMRASPWNIPLFLWIILASNILFVAFSCSWFLWGTCIYALRYRICVIFHRAPGMLNAGKSFLVVFAFEIMVASTINCSLHPLNPFQHPFCFSSSKLFSSKWSYTSSVITEVIIL